MLYNMVSHVMLYNMLCCVILHVILCYITVMSCYVASYFMLYNILFLGYITCYVLLCLLYLLYNT